MIDPTKITNYNLTDHQLEEHIIFWLLVAGKTARVVAKQYDDLLQKIDTNRPYQPFNAFRNYRGDLAILLKNSGMGCYNGKAKGITKLVNSEIDLRTCAVNELEEIPWIGMKTARCFVVHSRQNARHACLDTHVLYWLGEQGFDVPKSTPSKREYLALEEAFLALADELEMTPAELDLWIWNQYSRKINITQSSK